MENQNTESLTEIDPEYRRLHDGAPRPRGAARDAGRQAAAVRGRGDGREETEEGEAPAQGPHGGDRAHTTARGSRTEDSPRPGGLGLHPPAAGSSRRRRRGDRARNPGGGLLALSRSSCCPFFRDPERTSREARRRSSLPPTEPSCPSRRLPSRRPGPRRRISIFMSVFNCHVNRSPVSGRPRRLRLLRRARSSPPSMKRPRPRTSRTGSRSRPARSPVTFKQIAGALARRIVFYPRVGGPAGRGQRIGMIQFGSRVDLFVPDGAELLVTPGRQGQGGDGRSWHDGR